MSGCNKWKVTYSINGTFFSEHVYVENTYNYIDGAHDAMHKVKGANPNAKNLMAQMV